VFKYQYKIICRNCGTVDGMAKEGLDLSRLKCSKCKRIGTTVYIKKRSKAMTKKKKWELDNRVMVAFGDEIYPGTITELTKTKATVLFDDGEVHSIKLMSLKPEIEKEDEGQGFQQYEIKWDNHTVNFKFKTAEAEYHGWWRKIGVKDSDKIGYGIDIFVIYEGKRYNVETIPYINEDPRKDLPSLNADIGAAANKWFYYKCKGTFETIKDLEQRAAKPTITIHRLETLDRILIKLKEYRDTALRSGGFRVMTFTGDDSEKDPSMRIEMDLTTQAAALQGRVPALIDGVILDRVGKDSSKRTKGRGQQLTVSADPKNVKVLIEKLAASKDKAECRKIRAALRKMGHKGGKRLKL